MFFRNLYAEQLREYFMKNKKTNVLKLRNILAIIAIAAVIGFSFTACDTDAAGDDDGPGNEPVIKTITFEEIKWDNGDGTFGGWAEPGHEDWNRWEYYYQDAKKSFDLADAYSKGQVYVFNYSFTSNRDIDRLYVRFANREPEWKQVSDQTEVNIWGDIKKGKKYSGRVPIFPNGDAIGCSPENIFLNISIKNRDDDKAATLSFYKFSLEIVPEETYVNESWTVSGKQIKVSDDTRMKYAKNESSFMGKNNVFHIKPTYNASVYDHVVMEYDLSAYAGRTIGIEMKMDAYVKKPSRVAWQINSTDPFYPVIVGNIEENFFLPANKWNTITGTNIITVPASGDAGKKVYLSGMQINGAEAYFANATFTIDENPNSEKKDSVDGFKDDEPNMGENKSRGDVRKGGTVTIKIPSPLPSAGPATFEVDTADALIAKINSSTGTDCVVQGLEIGTARIKVTVGNQNAIVIISILPDQTGTYKLPQGQVKKLGDYTKWDNGSNNRPGDLPSDYKDYTAEPTTQLAWNWRNKGGSHGASGGDCGIDFLAYYVDPANSNKRGWVRTTYGFAGWHYDLNDKTNNMTNGKQTEGNIELELIPEFVYDNGVPYLQITHKITNKGASKVTNQKFGASADIMLYGNDSAPLSYMKYGALMTNATAAAPNPTIKFRLVCQNVTGVDNVSTLWMGRFGDERSYVYVDKREDVTGVDSAMNFSYRNIDLNAGQSKTFIVRFTQIQ
jgi:hypothetical protein